MGSAAEGLGVALILLVAILFTVDTLEYLRRGGRIGAAAALLGSALAVKPLLTIENGRVGMLEKVRTAGRALSRLEELAVVGSSPHLRAIVGASGEQLTRAPEPESRLSF